MLPPQDVAFYFEDFPRSDCDYVNEIRSTSECDAISCKEPVLKLFRHQPNYLEKDAGAQPLFFARQPDSISQIINHIEEPIFIESEEEICPDPISIQVPESPAKLANKKHKKNSNAIKKIGRIILNFIQKFNLGHEQNEGVAAMMKLLNKKSKEGENPKDFRDRFNVSHLQALFTQCSEQVSTLNLRVAKRLFNRQLRKQILTSFQIKGHNKVTYLNTLKCSSLRFCNKKLALRLQLSEILD